MALAPHSADTIARSVRIPIIAQLVRDFAEQAAPDLNTVMKLQQRQVHMAYEVNVWQLQLIRPTWVAAVSIGPMDGNHGMDDGIALPISSPDIADSRANSFRRRTLPSSKEYPAAPFCMVAELLTPAHRFQPAENRMEKENLGNCRFISSIKHVIQNFKFQLIWSKEGVHTPHIIECATFK